MTPRTLVLFLITAALWGASYLFIKVALDDGMSEGVILCARCGLGALVLLPLALRQGAIAPALERRGWIAVLAVTQVLLPFTLIVVGENWIDSGLAGILIAAAPIFMALIAPFVDPEESSTGLAAVGVIIGMAGVVLLFVADIGGVGTSAILGGLAVLTAAAVYALAPLVFKLRFQGVPHVGALAVLMTTGAIVFLPWALATLPSHTPELKTWLSLLVLGMGGTGVSFLLFYEMIEDIGPARASVVAYVAPLFSVVYGVVLLDELFTPWTLVGMALILGGSWLAARRPNVPDPEL